MSSRPHGLLALLAPTPGPSGTVNPTPVPSAPGSRLVEILEQLAGWVAARPWLALIVIAAIVAGTAVRGAVWRWRHARLTRHAHQILITPPPEVDPAGAHAWWANLYELLAPHWRRRLLYGTPHTALEYRWSGRELTIVVWVPGTVAAGPVAAAARAAWPGATCTVTDATAPIPTSAVHARGGALAPALAAWYPLATDHDTDPLRALVAAGAGLHNTERACVQVLARPATPRQVARLRRGAAALRTGRPPGGGPLDPTAWARGVLNLTTEIVTPGSPGALLHRGPLRTGHARSRAHGPSKPLGRFRSSVAARCFLPPGGVCPAGSRWRVRGVSVYRAMCWACCGGPGSPP